MRPPINISVNNTYKALWDRSFTKERIFYLNPRGEQDFDGDGESDVNRTSSRANIEYAITKWAHDKVSANVPLLIYLVGHCENDTFFVNGKQDTLTASYLNNSLNNLTKAKGCDDITVICEGRNSGNFIDDLSNNRRVIISSTGVTPCSKYHKEMGGVFTHCFFDNISSGKTIKAAFENASNSSVIKHYSTFCMNKGHLAQTPWLDDNGDCTGSAIPLNGTGDGNRTKDKYIGTQRKGYPYNICIPAIRLEGV